MSQNICNICGANYEYRNGRWKCPACGAFKAEELSNEEVTLLYNAAQKLRVQDFIGAEELYLDITHKYPKQHEAYWGYVCARYGIKHETDFDGKAIPTCCNPTIESFSDDKDFRKAVELAPAYIAEWYKGQAAYIDRVRSAWLEKAQAEIPYEVFISYKDSDLENGIERTQDSYNALELYNHLARQGYNVFYSRESLRDKIGEKYEPYIFNALRTSKVMIVYGTSAEHINSTWLKNEWHRYIKQIANGEKKDGSLIVVCDGFSPAELPSILSSKQCLDGTSKTLYVDIDHYLKQLFSSDKKEEKGTKTKKKQIVSPLHEHIYIDEVVPSTCMARGYTLHKCNCGYEYKDTYTKLGEHTYELKNTVNPSCDEEGYQEFVCKECGDKKQDPIPAIGHSFAKWIEVTKPSCNRTGKKARQCEKCGFVEEAKIPTLGHDWSAAEYRGSTSGEGAYYVVCNRCGEEKVVDDYLTNGVHKHKYTIKTVKPTCTEKGYTIHKCLCGYEYKDRYTEPAHKFKLVKKIEPICDRDGKETYECENCGKIEEKTLQKLGHTFGEWVEERKPTCVSDGVLIRTCEKCGKVERKTIKSEGHKWSKPKKVGSEYVFDCSLCGQQARKVLPFAKEGDIFNFGKHDGKAIKWRVLEIQGDKALIITEQGIDGDYGSGTHNDGWYVSNYRSWLNTSFYWDSFDSDEQARIIETSIENQRIKCIQKYIIGTIKETVSTTTERTFASDDKIFLLSLEEQKKYKLENLVLKNGETGKADYYNGHKWILRTSKEYYSDKGHKWSSTLLRTEGTTQYLGDLVRPAMWIDIRPLADVKKRFQAEEAKAKADFEKATAEHQQAEKEEKTKEWLGAIAGIIGLPLFIGLISQSWLGVGIGFFIELIIFIVFFAKQFF